MYAVYPIVCLAAAVLVSSLWGSVARRASARAVWVCSPALRCVRVRCACA